MKMTEWKEEEEEEEDAAPVRCRPVGGKRGKEEINKTDKKRGTEQ